ncbi:MAG: hypothetical protein NTU94_17860 [Planctomycetota bacterium]|nr:hypothetical protein [Planctomycetota bacterium]
MADMTRENSYFDVRPRIVPADRKATIEIRSLFDHCRLEDTVEYEVTYYPVEEIALKSGWKEKQARLVKPAGGVLRVEQYFEAEQEHVILVDRVNGERRQRVGDFRVYSVAADLFGRRPFKGDFHIHSSRSDGKESPAYVAGACRRIGLDFMAVTDHKKYAPSLEAQRAFQGVEIDLRILAGEEVHPPDNPVHIVNYGGRFSVNDLFADEAAYREAVEKVAAKVGKLPEGVDRYSYASAVWCFDRIREGGGLGIFCHPYWFTEHRYSPAGALTSYLFETQPFDAYEVIGGYTYDEFDSNTLQAARYHEERVRGRRLPIVGVTDAHGCENRERGLFGWYYTIVFAPSLAFEDVTRSVKDLYSVAVEAVPGDRARPVGPLRLVKYALFLLREVFPPHDELCVEEGRLMLAHAAELEAAASGAPADACPLARGGPAGGKPAAAALARLRGQTAALMDRCWAARV